MVNLTRIYTRTGDDGSTSPGRLQPDHARPIRAWRPTPTSTRPTPRSASRSRRRPRRGRRATLTRVQNDLFDVGADLCNPLAAVPRVPAAAGPEPGSTSSRPTATATTSGLEPLRSLHPARREPGRGIPARRATVVRRAERSAWAAIAAHGDQPGTERPGGVNRLTATYLNRLSDLLFILARVANVERGGDVLWQPGGGRAPQPGGAGERAGHQSHDEEAD